MGMIYVYSSSTYDFSRDLWGFIWIVYELYIDLILCFCYEFMRFMWIHAG